MPATDLIPFKIGKASPANTFLAIWMADAAGLYRDHGLDVEIVEMVGGSDTGPALTSGRLHLMHIGMSSVVRANAAGHAVTTIGSLSNVIRSALFTAPGITTAADLKGGIVGISSTGSESDLTTTLGLAKLGLARTDMGFEEIGVERLDAVRTGQVAATMLGEPYRSRAQALGVHVIIDLLAERIPWLYSGLVVGRDYLEANRDAVERFLRATVEGNYLAVADGVRAKEVLARELGLTEPAIIEATFENFKSQTPANAELTRDGAENVIATVTPGLSANPDDYMDSSVYESLRNEGFFAAMAETYA